MRYIAIIVMILFTLLFQAQVRGFTLRVRDPNGNPVRGFRWQVEEDTTNYVVPGVPVTDSISVNIHNSYAPVVLNGHSDGGRAVIDLPSNKRYVVSVLPDEGYSISGNLVDLNQDTVTVTVNPQPVPTAQITVLAFHDIGPINNAPDVGEAGLEGFSVIISDIGGQQMADAFGNMLGTTYVMDPNTGEPVVDPNTGDPVVEMLGTGVILTDANGEATIKYIAPHKYGVQVIPPAGQGWVQTSTIEGTKVVDAWVKANEPPMLVEFGPALYHIFDGFVQQFDDLGTLPPDPNGIVGEITGRLVYNHVNRPLKEQGLFSGEPVGTGWVGLNAVGGQGLYAAPCNEDGTFTISNVPPGLYELVTWDVNLDSIFGFNQVVIPAEGGTVALGDVLAFAWFGKLEGSVFYDTNQNGFRDDGEVGIENQNVNLRFRDGTIYQAQPTDMMGEYAFEEVFPFFKWLVAEVDFARFKDTGMTTVVDFGGEIPADDGWDIPSFGKLNPQPQTNPDGTDLINPNTGNNLSRTEVSTTPGEVLLQATQIYAGQTNIIDWGKIAYGPDENGGISGVVFYDTTRAENDPRYCAGEPWQPGIPRVQVALYMDSNNDGVIDDVDGNGRVRLADVDNYPFGWRDNPALFEPGVDIDRNDNGQFNAGDAIQIVTTDSWDDSKPEWGIRDTELFVHGAPVPPTIDNFSTWNQVQPGVFDGGYAIGSYFPGGIDSGNAEVDGLPAGIYIVQAAMPPGYEVVKEEDKNVDFGDTYVPGTLLLPPLPVGRLHTVPAELTLFPGVPCEFAGQQRPLADRKQVIVSAGENAAADFFFFTPVPKAARAVGFVNNDIAAEFDPTNPRYGEKGGPSWIPISFQDWAGNEVARVYLDEFGTYNALLPSTVTAKIPAPSGMSPHMLSFVINHPGPVPDPDRPGQMMLDPFYDLSYSQTAYTFNFMPGTTTYLDTPVIQVAAFAGYPNRKMDVEPANGTPVIHSVRGPQGGPIVCTNGDTVVIRSVGNKMVPNPAHDPENPASPALIERDFGFGETVGTVTVDDVALGITSWSNGIIRATVDFASVNTGTVAVTRGDNGKSSELGVTLHVNTCANVIHVKGGSFYPETPIQDAIDAATNGALIIIHPGTYWENPIVYKPVTLQGSGAESTILNGTHSPSNKLAAWRDKFNQLVADANLPEAANIIPQVEAPTVMVYANAGVFTENAQAVVDGLTITGATAGGGIYAHGNADYLEIRNNRIQNNQGTIGGGVIIGHNILGATPTTNVNVNIHDNYILLNGGISGGGGVVLFNGSTNYKVTSNLIMGNFSRLVGGGGITHKGLCDNGLIAHNSIVFNEIAYGGQVGGDGGGIFIGSTVGGGLNEGAGSVTIHTNLIQGNIAGTGVGGGICVEGINGADTQNAPQDWYQLNIFNNMIVNNVAAYAAGGIYLSDAAAATIINNTIANNDSAGTAALAFTAGNLGVSNPQPAGIVSVLHSNGTLITATGQDYSDPLLEDNIIHGNRSFYWDIALNGGQGGLTQDPNNPVWDLAVLNRQAADQRLHPDFCLLSSLTDSLGNDYNANNLAADPNFALPYNNTLVAALVIEEGGNAITTRFNEVDRQGDYHIAPTSPAKTLGAGTYVGTFVPLETDFDGESRVAVDVDSGADQCYLDPNIFSVAFNSGTGGFAYFDDTFNDTNAPAYASGVRIDTGGLNDTGALQITLGGIDNMLVKGMSGGWQKTFTVPLPGTFRVLFRYNITQSPNYETNETSRVRFSVDGEVFGPGNDSLITGDGDGGPEIMTGWQLLERTVTLTEAGEHKLIIGGYNNRKDNQNEVTTILIDDVTVAWN
jgi:parallel beta-helix repeat protein